MAWVDAIGVIVLTVAAGFGGYVIGKLRAPWSALGYAVPFLLIILIALPRRIPAWEFVPPFSWIHTGRLEFALLGPAIACLFMSVVRYTSTRTMKYLVIAFMSLAALFATVLPFLFGAINSHRLTSMQTRIDGNGVCLQSSAMTCGPAAAVTALRSLGIAADEGDLAARARTNILWGTPPDILTAVIQSRHGQEGLQANYRIYNSLQDVKGREPVLAVIRFGTLVDHYVVIMKVQDNRVEIADPLKGLVTMTPDQFERIWRGTGISVSRDKP